MAVLTDIADLRLFELVFYSTPVRTRMPVFLRPRPPGLRRGSAAPRRRDL